MLLSPFPYLVHMSVLSPGVSVPALHTGSSVPFLLIPSIYINVCYLPFSFSLTSRCLTDSRSIHISTNNPVSILFVVSDSPPCLCTTPSLPITVRLLPCAGDRKQHWNKHWGTRVFLNCFPRVIRSVVGFWIMRKFCFLWNLHAVLHRG